MKSISGTNLCFVLNINISVWKMFNSYTSNAFNFFLGAVWRVLIYHYNILPYRGKLRRGKVTGRKLSPPKISPDEHFPDE